MEFNGFRRSNGIVGTRNYVGILSMVVCANEVADAISRQVQGTAPFMHQQGCCQTPIDIKRVKENLIGLGRNPNLASVLLMRRTHRSARKSSDWFNEWKTGQSRWVLIFEAVNRPGET